MVTEQMRGRDRERSLLSLLPLVFPPQVLFHYPQSSLNFVIAHWHYRTRDTRFPLRTRFSVIVFGILFLWLSVFLSTSNRAKSFLLVPPHPHALHAAVHSWDAVGACGVSNIHCNMRQEEQVWKLFHSTLDALAVTQALLLGCTILYSSTHAQSHHVHSP